MGSWRSWCWRCLSWGAADHLSATQWTHHLDEPWPHSWYWQHFPPRYILPLHHGFLVHLVKRNAVNRKPNIALNYCCKGFVRSWNVYSIEMKRGTTTRSHTTYSTSTYCVLQAKNCCMKSEGNTHSGPPDIQTDHRPQWHCVLCIGTDQHPCTWHSSEWGRTHEHHSSLLHFHPDSKWEQKPWFREYKSFTLIFFITIFAHLHLQSTFLQHRWPAGKKSTFIDKSTY